MLIYKLYWYNYWKIINKAKWERAKFYDHKQTDSTIIQLPFSQSPQGWSYSKESVSTFFGLKTIATMVPPKLEFLQESHYGRGKKTEVRCHSEEELDSGKRFHSSNDLSDHHAWDDQTMLGQWWAGHHLDQDCLIIYLFLAFCLNLNLMLWTQDRLRRPHITLFFFSMGPNWIVSPLVFMITDM